MLQSTKESNTDFNQTLQNVWFKLVLYSKLSGGLANNLIDLKKYLFYTKNQANATKHKNII